MKLIFPPSYFLLKSNFLYAASTNTVSTNTAYSDEIERNEQAGAELCQAQPQVDMQAEFFLQLNFGFGQHWKK